MLANEKRKDRTTFSITFFLYIIQICLIFMFLYVGLFLKILDLINIFSDM